MKSKLYLLFALTFALIGCSSPEKTETPQTEVSTIDSQDLIVFEMYHGRECPHCQEQHEWLEENFIGKYPNVRIEKYEVWHDATNNQRMLDRHEEIGYPAPTGVPANIINGIAFTGFSAEKITQAVEKAQEEIDKKKLDSTSEEEDSTIEAEESAEEEPISEENNN